MQLFETALMNFLNQINPRAAWELLLLLAVGLWAWRIDLRLARIDESSRHVAERFNGLCDEFDSLQKSHIELIEKVAENRAQIATIPRINPHPRPA
jgi:hypothetical protein